MCPINSGAKVHKILDIRKRGRDFLKKSDRDGRLYVTFFYAVSTSGILCSCTYLIEIFRSKANFIRPIYGKRI